MSNSQEESINHLFLTCRVARKIWSMRDKWIGPQSLHHNLVEEHFLGFELVGLSINSNYIGSVVWVALIWNIII